jgi:hypothetical protein
LELYSSFLKLAPLVLLKLLAKDGFGPSGQDTDRRRRVALAGNIVLSVAVAGSGFIAFFVLGDVLAPSAATRGVLVVVGSLSLLVLAKFKFRQIASLHRAGPGGGTHGGSPSGASAFSGESS